MTASTDMPRKRRVLRRAGFTLLEFAISLGFMSAMAGLIAGSSFLSLRTTAETGAKATVAVETAKTTSWLVRDVHRTLPADTTVADGGSAVASASLTWDNSGTPETCTYSLTGTDMQRACTSGTSIVGHYISGLEFVRNGRLVTVTYTITPSTDPSAAQEITLSVALGGV